MTILTMEMRGLRDISPEYTAAIVRATADWRRESASMLNMMPSQTPLPSVGAGMNASTLLATWGPRVGAGLAGLAVGLVLAKLARRRKKG